MEIVGLIIMPLLVVGAVFAWQHYDNIQKNAILNDRKIDRKRSPDVHVICGKCGRNDFFVYTAKTEIDDMSEDENATYIQVYLHCGNCGTLTGLDEIMKDGDKTTIN